MHTPPVSHLNTASSDQLILDAEQQLQKTIWPQLDAIHYHTFQRVLEGFIANRVGEEHFASVTGYGHNDMGRDVTDAVFAHALQAESALVRVQIVSGTHALSVGLNGCLAPGQTMLSITGRPYDTLEEVIGLRGDSKHSLKSRNIAYQEFSLIPSDPDSDAIRTHLTPEERHLVEQADLIFIQRSRGYSLRPSLTIEALSQMIAKVKSINPKAIIMVDNCYGEFTQKDEPTAVGADLIAGSLIKNPGGGIVPAGGYVAGRKDLIDACADWLTCPGVGAEGGYTFNLSRLLLQGLYLAPGIVKEALKGMTLAAYCFNKAGYQTTPTWDRKRSDIIQILTLGDPQKQIRFCQILQGLSPISSNVVPVPAQPPGYADEVIMAGGTFIDGSTLELSADGPLRAPYSVYLQGGLTYAHTRFAVKKLLDALAN